MMEEFLDERAIYAEIYSNSQDNNPETETDIDKELDQASYSRQAEEAHPERPPSADHSLKSQSRTVTQSDFYSPNEAIDG